MVDTVKEIGKKFKGKSGKEIVDELLGNEEPATARRAPPQQAKAKELLNKFLKPQ